MSEFIDPAVVDGSPLHEDHPAKRYASGLPTWHPVRQLFTEEEQWIGGYDAVYGFFHVLAETYEDRIAHSYTSGAVRSAPMIDDSVADAMRELFLERFPDHVLHGGDRYRLHRLYAKARGVIDAMTACASMRASGLEAFDRTFSRLVRAVSLS